MQIPFRYLPIKISCLHACVNKATICASKTSAASSTITERKEAILVIISEAGKQRSFLPQRYLTYCWLHFFQHLMLSGSTSGRHSNDVHAFHQAGVRLDTLFSKILIIYSSPEILLQNFAF